MADLTGPTPGFRDLEHTLGQLNRLTRRLMDDLKTMSRDDIGRLRDLYLGAIDWWDWTTEGRAAWYSEVAELVAKYPEGDETHEQ